MALTNFQRYRRIAQFYDLLDLPLERKRYRPLRPLMFQGLSGHILDAGVGTGRNFPFYPPGATVVGLDISPAMLGEAERRLNEATAPVELLGMDVTRLDFPDASFDAAVATFLFCVLDKELQVPGLRELGRVVKPGGSIRFLEYVRPSRFWRRFLTRLWQPWIAWGYCAGFDVNSEACIGPAWLGLVDAGLVLAGLIKLIEARAPTAPV